MSRFNVSMSAWYAPCVPCVRSWRRLSDIKCQGSVSASQILASSCDIFSPSHHPLLTFNNVNDGQLFSCWVVLRGFTPSIFPGSSIAFEYMLAEMEKEIPFRLKLGVLKCPCCLCVSHCWGFLMQGVTSSHSTTRNSSKGSHVTILTKQPFWWHLKTPVQFHLHLLMLKNWNLDFSTENQLWIVFGSWWSFW